MQPAKPPTTHCSAAMVKALTRTTRMFAEGHHLDLTPWSDRNLTGFHVTTATDMDLGPALLEASARGDAATFNALEAQRLAAKPSREDMLASFRKHREDELLTPVKRVEVTFHDKLHRKPRRWNFTHGKVHRMLHAPAFHTLVATALSTGFTTAVHTESFFNAAGQPVVKLKLVFEKFNRVDDVLSTPKGGLARTFTWSETP